jgi:transposase InsO family protein
MCLLLAVPRSSYYAWRTRAETPTAVRRRELGVEVRRVFAASRQTFGCRRVTAQLNRDCYACCVGLVAGLMRDLGLRAVQPRGYRRTTVPGEQPVNSPDLLLRNFDPDSCKPCERLVGDITYLRTGQGWLYLATVIDLATRMVIGLQLTDHARTSLVVDAGRMAIDAGRVAPGAIFHSDRGCQYTSTHYVAFCNRQRLHSTLGYRTPFEALTNHHRLTNPSNCPRSLTQSSRDVWRVG